MHKPIIGLILVSIVLLALCGCSERIEYRTSYTTFEDAWLKDCELVPPPDPIVYKQASERVRNVMWSQVYANQAALQAKCHLRTAAARKYNESLRQKNAAQP